MKISILVCTLNEESNIERRILNLLELRIPRHVILDIHVLDNGSTDNTYKIAEKFTNLSGVRVCAHKLGGIGKCSALFWAYENLSSDYYIMTDANTVFNSSGIIEIIGSIRKNKKSTLHIGNFRSVTSAEAGEFFFAQMQGMSSRHGIEGYMNFTSGANGACYCIKSEAIDGIWKYPAVRNDDFVISVYAANSGSVSSVPNAKAYEVENLTAREAFHQKYRDALGHYQAVIWLLRYSLDFKVLISVLFRLFYWSIPGGVALLLFFLLGWPSLLLLLAFVFIGRVRTLLIRTAALYAGFLVGIIKPPSSSWRTKR